MPSKAPERTYCQKKLQSSSNCTRKSTQLFSCDDSKDLALICSGQKISSHPFIHNQSASSSSKAHCIEKIQATEACSYLPPKAHQRIFCQEKLQHHFESSTESSSYNSDKLAFTCCHEKISSYPSLCNQDTVNHQKVSNTSAIQKTKTICHLSSKDLESFQCPKKL